MNVSQSARISIVVYSLVITGCLILFLIISQPLGMPFDYGLEQNLRLIDVTIPTFLGYLGSASHFIFNTNRGRDVDEDNAVLLKILIHGPFLIFICAVIGLFFVFYQTNQPLPVDAPRVDPMKFGTLSRYFSICLGLLAVTVSIISSYLFGSPPQNVNKQSGRDTARRSGKENRAPTK
ncbi:hypothetical protein [Rhizobium ruizarguesonis]|uniref:hypothetical protein n=1 Tax=Rhizobium ruizarguesonis TaxID=2081791 RepID=UPI0010312F49|nr:hypothetical protein [Rhizobium ruizarguesonis]TAZ53243.1 hypothetical protein ELH76_19820 [Rhizobium ruizarguesonis]